jgi:hypothetical protein
MCVQVPHPYRRRLPALPLFFPSLRGPILPALTLYPSFTGACTQRGGLSSSTTKMAHRPTYAEGFRVAKLESLLPPSLPLEYVTLAHGLITLPSIFARPS